MSDRTLRMSRRKLLRLGSLVPLTALLARGATAEEMAEALRIHSDVLTTFWNKGHGHNGNVPEGHFKKMATALWTYFEAGLDARGGKHKLPTDSGTLVILAGKIYDQPNQHNLPSGHLITDAIEHWTKPDPTTNGCAYLCGFYTAEAALDLDHEIDESIYKIGFKRTERQMKATLARLRSRKGQAAADDDARRGAGC